MTSELWTFLQKLLLILQNYGVDNMFSPEYKIKLIDYRINIMRQRNEIGNMHIINALMRERRQYEREIENK